MFNKLKKWLKGRGKPVARPTECCGGSCHCAPTFVPPAEDDGFTPVMALGMILNDDPSPDSPTPDRGPEQGPALDREPSRLEPVILESPEPNHESHTCCSHESHSHFSSDVSHHDMGSDMGADASHDGGGFSDCGGGVD